MIGALLLLAAPAVEAADAQATITFTRLIIKDDDGRVLGSSTEQLRAAMNQRMKDAGLNVLGTDDAMFGDTGSGSADYLLGGQVTAIAWRDLAPYGVEVTVEWKLLDRSTNELAYTVVTRGYEEGPTALSGLAAGKALDDAVDRVLARPKLKEVLQHRGFVTGLPPAVWDAPLRVRQCARPALKLPTDMKKALEGVVTVKAGSAIGSGAIISPDGFVVTAAHVVGDEAAPTVKLKSGVELKATVVRVDEAQDVALLDVSGDKNPCIPLSAEEPGAGTELFAVGAPMGLEFTVSKGVVSSLRTLDGYAYVQTDAAISPGASGGPMLDAAGRAMAVVSWKVDAKGFDGLGFGVPVAALRARLGIDYGDASDTDLPARSGRVVRRNATTGGVVDEPDVTRLIPVSSAERHAIKVRRRRVSGAVIGTAGLVGVGYTAYWASQVNHASSNTWDLAVAGNTAGWVGVLWGGALLGASFMPAGQTAADAPLVIGYSGRF